MREFIKGLVLLFIMFAFGVVGGCIATQRYYEEHLELNKEKLRLEIQVLKKQIKEL